MKRKTLGSLVHGVLYNLKEKVTSLFPFSEEGKAEIDYLLKVVKLASAGLPFNPDLKDSRSQVPCPLVFP